MNWKAETIIMALARTRFRKAGTVMPRYTPKGWWECDLAEVTKAGFLREYEVKVTKADFKADAEKRDRSWRGDGETKHAKLLRGDPAGPVQFWFVVPTGLIRIEEVPVWAGLIVVSLRPGWTVLSGIVETEVKKAPRLHRAKTTTHDHMRGVSYYRMHDMLTKQFRKLPL